MEDPSGAAAANVSIANSRTISYEETTKRTFSFSVEDLAQSDADGFDSKLPRPLSSLVTSEAPEKERKLNPNASQPLRPSNSKKRRDSEDKPEKPNKKARSLFSVEQVFALEQCFQQQKYLGTKERLELAQALSMSETQVKTWFQSRRIKLKRKQTELAERYAKMAFVNAVTQDMLPQQRSYHGYQSAVPAPSPVPSPSYFATPRVLCNELYQADRPAMPYAPAQWNFPPNSLQVTRPPFQLGYQRQPEPYDL